MLYTSASVVRRADVRKLYVHPSAPPTPSVRREVREDDPSVTRVVSDPVLCRLCHAAICDVLNVTWPQIKVQSVIKMYGTAAIFLKKTAAVPWFLTSPLPVRKASKMPRPAIFSATIYLWRDKYNNQFAIIITIATTACISTLLLTSPGNIENIS